MLNSTLNCGDVTFHWTDNGTAVSQWWLHVGTMQGENDILDRDMGGLTSCTVTGIPEDGSTVYLRLWYKSEGTWKSAYFQYTACGGGGCAGFEEYWSDNDNAPDWIRDSGTWRVDDDGCGRGSDDSCWSDYYHTDGVSNKSSTSTYNAIYSNFDFSAELKRGSIGNNKVIRLLVRASGAVMSNGKPANSYSFQIRNSGKYSIYKTLGGVTKELQGWTLSSAINTNEHNSNILRVVAHGDSLTFFINGRLVWSGHDTSLASGRVGFGFASDTSTDGLSVNWAKLDCLQ
ncbi:MAG: DUF1080 domain-containing protein [Candidatus Scalindua sp.]|nr:DUF1080 domain-containing protein [Candidatus Scalindua sp.]